MGTTDPASGLPDGWKPGDPIPHRSTIIVYDGPSSADPGRPDPYAPGGEFGAPAAAEAATAPALEGEHIEARKEPPLIIARLEALEEIGVTQKELDKALAPMWREIDRILAQLGMHREKAS